MSERAFVWATHQVAATRWLKAELARTAPHLQFAFSRPGLTTFRVDTDLARDRPPGGTAASASLEEVQLPSSFARAWGASLGRASSAEQALALLGPRLDQPVRLHVFERDIDVPADEQDPELRGRRAAAVEAALRALAPQAFLPEARALAGEVVVDVIVPHSSEPEEPYLVGTHRHDAHHGPLPGGVGHIAPPADAPSRAWCKVEEAICWANLSPVPGDTAVEIGSAPGGATLALLRRGLTVYGIDPGEMHPLTKGFRGTHGNRFVHLHMPAAEVPKRALPHQYQWLLLDVNLAPMVALRYVERFVALAHGGLKGAVLTIKLNDEGVFLALPRLLERIQKLGATNLRVTQLPSHRSEVVAILTW
jgi:23S rRNA (cytidine2498-2'-O)-methyltransferase